MASMNSPNHAETQTVPTDYDDQLPEDPCYSPELSQNSIDNDIISEIQSTNRIMDNSEEVPNRHVFRSKMVEDTGLTESRMSDLDIRSQSSQDRPNLKSQSATHSQANQQTANSKRKISLFPFMAKDTEENHQLHHINTSNNEEKKPFQNKLLRAIRRAKRTEHMRSPSTLNQGLKDHSHELEVRNKLKTEFLLNSMIVGFPVALIISTYFTTDEHGVKRVPMLLQLLSLTLTDITTNPLTRKRKFKIDLDYGIGDNLLRWSLEKTSKDLANLNNKLRLQFLQENVLLKGNKELELPKFPKYKIQQSQTHQPGKTMYGTVLPDPLSTSSQHPQNEVAFSMGQLPLPQARAVDDLEVTPYDGGIRSGVVSDRSSLVDDSNSETSSVSTSHSSVWRRHIFRRTRQPKEILTHEHYRDAIQEYLDILFRTLTLKAQANRIFQFFELSPIGVLLSHENGKKRKEGYLMIKTTAKAQGWRVGHLRVKDLKAMVERHTAKWFLVGHSYIMYVADINSTTPLDVFLVDSDFKFTLSGLGDVPITNDNFHEFLKQQQKIEDDEDDDEDGDQVIGRINSQSNKSYLSLTLENSERKLSVVGKSANQMRKWCLSISEMMEETSWGATHRFKSFAPPRDNCFAQWFVDSRDYMYAASSALEMAKDVIYIHDWWLSPELYMRRPANGNQEWRLDRILKRKAEQGVKIFVIIYRNVGNTVVTDSLWTKHSLLDLHENVYVLRSPNQLMQNVYFWAHHEKMLVVDHTVCFIGGVDLCYGRYDTPDHVLVDDAPYAFESQIPPSEKHTEVNALDYQNFPGKDYSNPRMRDFSDLDSPFENMFDRQVTPRMPWHDVHMMSSGQVARDLSRHFVQRWNYLLRQKRPSRPTPLLLPPRDFTAEELEKLGISGTCEIQILRSSCSWSLGIQKPELSIQTAYLKAIETSEHFIHIENQFFVTTHEHAGVIIKNKIGDALVERIIRAHRNRQVWKAVIVIPLMPGFSSEVDSKEGSSVRVIMQCQFMSISMGETSIYAKLRRAGIRPEDYIQFYSLRKWGYIGKKKMLVTEQLYIHAKTMIVDDRIAIIGSANINERSMKGTRDSELAAIVRDKQMIDTFMDGKPYKAGKFAHTLRMRLMREHLGVDVDLLDMVERRFSQIESFASSEQGLKASTLNIKKGDHALSAMVELGARYVLDEPEGTDNFKSILDRDPELGKPLTDKLVSTLNLSKVNTGASGAPIDDDIDAIPYIYSFNHRAGNENAGIRDRKSFSTDSRVTDSNHRSEVNGHGADKYHSGHFTNSKVKVTKILQDWAESTFLGRTNITEPELPYYEDVVEFLTNNDDSTPIDILNRERWDMLKRLYYMNKIMNKNRMEADRPVAEKDENGNGSAGTDNIITPENTETKLPTVPSITLSDEEIDELNKNSLPQTASNLIDPYAFEDPLEIDFFEGTWMTQALRNTLIFQMVFHVQPDDSVQSWKDYKSFQELNESFMLHQKISRCVSSTSASTSNSETKVGSEADALSEIGPKPERRDSEEDYGSADEGDLLDDYNLHTTEAGQQPPLSNGTTKEPTVDMVRNTIRRSKISQLDRFQRQGIASGISNINSKLPSYLGMGAVYDYETSEKLIHMIRGNLVQFPTRWLKKEVEGSNWFYAADKLPPIQIYN